MKMYKRALGGSTTILAGKGRIHFLAFRQPLHPGFIDPTFKTHLFQNQSWDQR